MYEAFNWQHGVFVGGSMRSEATAAAEHKGRYNVLHYWCDKMNKVILQFCVVVVFCQITVF